MLLKILSFFFLNTIFQNYYKSIIFFLNYLYLLGMATLLGLGWVYNAIILQTLLISALKEQTQTKEESQSKENESVFAFCICFAFFFLFHIPYIHSFPSVQQQVYYPSTFIIIVN